MPRLFVLALVLGAMLCTGGAKKPVVDIRIHAEGLASEAPSFAFPATLLDGRPVHLARMPLVSHREVKAIFPFDAADGTRGVYLKLDSHGSSLLNQHTTAARGGTLAVFINGRQVSNLRVSRQVSDGIVSIPRGLTEEDITVLTSAFPVLGGSEEKSGR